VRRGHNMWDIRVNVADLRSSDWCVQLAAAAAEAQATLLASIAQRYGDPNLGPKHPRIVDGQVQRC
jgi:hypothetical protein